MELLKERKVITVSEKRNFSDARTITTDTNMAEESAIVVCALNLLIHDNGKLPIVVAKALHFSTCHSGRCYVLIYKATADV